MRAAIDAGNATAGLSAKPTLDLLPKSGCNVPVTCHPVREEPGRQLSHPANANFRPKAVIAHLTKRTFRNVESE